ncbi:MAG: cell division protein FtsW [Coriobacteriales bacterium]|nr:cell division protein FtsW [Coriobacteriales bacterium]
MASRLMLIGTVIVLLALGAIMVYSASSVFGYTSNAHDATYFFKRHLVWIGAGIFIAFITALIKPRFWDSPVVWLIWVVLVASLIMVRFLGEATLGATRAFEIAGISVQPSELAKIVIPLTCAHQISRFHEGELSVGKFSLLMLLIVGTPVLLIVAQPDLGTSIIALVAVIAVMWFGELPRAWVALVIAVCVVLGVAMIALVSFRGDRIAAWLNPLSDQSSQIANGLYALSEGGLTGVGLGNSAQKYLYLQYAYNDFIFPIIGEELGWLGCIFVVVVFLLFCRSSLQVGQSASGIFGRMVAQTSGAVISFQAFLNMFCTTGLLPVTGKPLPFISYGGSSMITTMILVGLILSVSLHDSSDESGRMRGQIEVVQGTGKGDSDAGGYWIVDGSSARQTGVSGAYGSSRSTSFARRSLRLSKFT